MSALGNEIRNVAREIRRSDTRAVLNHLASKVDDLAPTVIERHDLVMPIYDEAEPQGEPSDAQVSAALDAWDDHDEDYGHVAMRAALRAAGSTP